MYSYTCPDIVKEYGKYDAGARPSVPPAPAHPARPPAQQAGARPARPARAPRPEAGPHARRSREVDQAVPVEALRHRPAVAGALPRPPARGARPCARLARGGGGGLTAREGVARGLTGALEEKTLREGKDAPRGGSSKWKLSPSLVVRSRTQAHPYPRGRRQADIAYERFLAPEIFFAPEIYNSQYIKPLPVRPSEPSQLNPRASSARALWP